MTGYTIKEVTRQEHKTIAYEKEHNKTRKEWMWFVKIKVKLSGKPKIKQQNNKSVNVNVNC